MHLWLFQVEMIITAPNSSYCLSSMAALRESQSLKANFTKTHAERVLDTFVARGWLYKSKFVLQLIAVIIPAVGSHFRLPCTGREGTPLRPAPQ